jgi:nucleoside-diphosphate-sugar epimerase
MGGPRGQARAIVVTGAGGFVGRNLLPRLLREGWSVRALLHPEEPERGLPELEIRRADITRPDSLAGCFDGAQAVLHLAGAVGYGQSLEVCRSVNRDGTAHVAAEALRAGARRFVQLSSVSVYGRTAGVPLPETAPRRRTGDPYGDSKIDAEEILEAHARAGELELTLLRPSVIYGPGDDKFLPKLVENLRSGRARIVGSGSHRVDAIHVEDVADVVVRVLADPRTIGRCYNLDHPGNPSWREFVEALAAELGSAPPRGHLPFPIALAAAGLMEWASRWTGRPPRLTRYAVRVVGRAYDYRVERAQRELGFAPRIGLLEGVRPLLARGG